MLASALHWSVAHYFGNVPEGGGSPFSRVAKLFGSGVHLGNINVTLGSLLAGVLLVLAFWVFSVLVRRGLRRYGDKYQRLSRSSLYALERLVHYALLVIGVLAGLRVAGIPMAQMVVFAGALGVGLGFGLQAIFNNFISGLILLFGRSLKIGDFVELESGVHGHVREIRIRYTQIGTNDGIDILVPNSEFVSGRVDNWTFSGQSRRMLIDFRVALDADMDSVERAGLEAAAAVPCTLKSEGRRAPSVWIHQFADSAIECQLVVWLDAEGTLHPRTARAACHRALLEALDRHAITIPYAQRTVRMLSEEGTHPDGRNGRRLKKTAGTGTYARPDQPVSGTYDDDAMSGTHRQKPQDMQNGQDD